MLFIINLPTKYKTFTRNLYVKFIRNLRNYLKQDMLVNDKNEKNIKQCLLFALIISTGIIIITTIKTIAMPIISYFI